MAKIQREKVTIEAGSYNFDMRYEQAMKEFDDVKVVSVQLLSSTEKNETIKESYLVFYQEIEEAEEEIIDNVIDSGDFVYWDNEYPRERTYETVEKVVFDDGMTKVFFSKTQWSEGGEFMPLEDVVLIAKRKDRKDML